MFEGIFQCPCTYFLILHHPFLSACISPNPRKGFLKYPSSGKSSGVVTNAGYADKNSLKADSIKILFDAGARVNTVLDNARELKIDLSVVPDLILSHSHDDHTTGWLPIRKEMSAIRPGALSVTHVAPGFFDTRHG